MQKELAYRENDGIAVTLFWHSGSNRLSVSVYDWRNGDWFELEAGRAERDGRVRASVCLRGTARPRPHARPRRRRCVDSPA